MSSASKSPISRGKPERILICEEEEDATSGSWDMICLPLYEMVHLKGRSSWQDFSISHLEVALQKTICLQEDMLRRIGTHFRRSSRATRQDNSQFLKTDLLLGASLISENSNVHKSEYLNRVVQLLWSINEIRDFGAGKSTPPKVFVASEEMMSILLELDPSFAENFSITLLGSRISRNPKRSIFSVVRREMFLAITLVKGVLWLMSKFARVMTLKQSEHKNLNVDSVFLDYFFDAPSNPESDGYSKYWKHLPEALARGGLSHCYAHIFVPDDKNPTLSAAKASSRNAAVCAIFLDDFVKPRHFKGLFLSLLWHYKSFRKVVDSDPPRTSETSNTWLRERQERDVAISLFGTVAATNLVYDAMFEEFALWAESSGVKQVVYVCEFQGWESLLVVKLREKGIRTIGYCHSTVRRLDLRGYLGLACHNPPPNSIRPDLLAAHSLQDLEMLQSRKGTASLALVESTRYSFRPIARVQVPRTSRQKVLVVGGYSDKETRFLLEVCGAVAASASDEFEFSFLRHPRSRVKSNTFESISRKNLGSFTDLMEGYSSVVCSAETSAAMEALLQGRRVTLVAAPGQLIASPVLGCLGVGIARNAADLGRSLRTKIITSSSELDKLRPCQAKPGDFKLWAEVMFAND